MGCMGISDLAIIRFVFHINAAKKKISIHNFDFGFGKIIDAVASLNPPVARHVDFGTRFRNNCIFTADPFPFPERRISPKRGVQPRHT
jgi:hypothetical protein